MARLVPAGSSASRVCRAADSRFLQSRLTIRTKGRAASGASLRSFLIANDRQIRTCPGELPGRESSMSFTRQRSGRSDWARRQAGLGTGGPREPAGALQAEFRRLRSRPGYPPICSSPIRSRTSASCSTRPRLVNPNDPNSPGSHNAGQDRHRHDRAGDKWTITVHGPGKVIVTDTTPNDGVLDDDINTIQLVGTNPRTTYVTGQR